MNKLLPQNDRDRHRLLPQNFRDMNKLLLQKLFLLLNIDVRDITIFVIPPFRNILQAFYSALPITVYVLFLYSPPRSLRKPEEGFI
jgi:hypothetical protein